MKTKKVRPLLVESKERTDLVLHLDRPNCIEYVPNQISVIGKTEYFSCQQLILISLDPDGNIEVGDKFALEGQNEPDVYEIFINDGEDCLLDANCKKVISTQENISPEYISKFVEEYNSGCVKDLETEMTSQTMMIGWKTEQVLYFLTQN